MYAQQVAICYIEYVTLLVKLSVHQANHFDSDVFLRAPYGKHYNLYNRIP